MTDSALAMSFAPLAPPVVKRSNPVDDPLKDGTRCKRPLWEGYNAFYGRHGDTALPAHLEGVYTQAGRAGVSRVYWQTHESNAAGRLLYDKVAKRQGFIVYSRDASAG